MGAMIPRLVALFALTILVACDTEPRNLPSAPSVTAHEVGPRRSHVPSPQGYPLLAYDPVKDRVWQVGGFNADGLIYDLWTFSPRSRKWTQIGNALGPTSWDAVALDARSRKLILYQGYSAAFDAVDVETWAYDIDTGVWENRQPAQQVRLSELPRDAKRRDVDLQRPQERVVSGVPGGSAERARVARHESNEWACLHVRWGHARRLDQRHLSVLFALQWVETVSTAGGLRHA